MLVPPSSRFGNLWRERRGRENLREERIWIERDRRYDAIQFLRRIARRNSRRSGEGCPLWNLLRWGRERRTLRDGERRQRSERHVLKHKVQSQESIS